MRYRDSPWRARPFRRHVPRRPPLVVIEVAGGLVQQVYASDRRLEIVGIDFDAHDGTAEHVLTVTDDAGQTALCFADLWRPLSTAKLPTETADAVRRTLYQR